MTHLWLDDVRPAPEGWTWARTNEEAKQILLREQVTHCSLDHDLGLHDVEIPEDPEEMLDVLMLCGNGPETGLDLVEWMIENERVPEHIMIHSWNPGGASLMAQRFVDAGHEVILMPYSPRNYP